MKITIVKREGPDIVADGDIVNEESLELGHYVAGQVSLSERLSEQIMTVAQLRGAFVLDQIADHDNAPKVFPFQLSKTPEHFVQLKGDKALKLILEEILATLPDEVEVRFA